MKVFLQYKTYETYLAALKDMISAKFEVSLSNNGFCIYQDGIYSCQTNGDYFRNEVVWTHSDFVQTKILQEYTFRSRSYPTARMFRVKNVVGIQTEYYIIGVFLGMGTRLDGTRVTVIRKSS